MVCYSRPGPILSSLSCLPYSVTPELTSLIRSTALNVIWKEHRLGSEMPELLNKDTRNMFSCFSRAWLSRLLYVSLNPVFCKLNHQKIGFLMYYSVHASIIGLILRVQT